MIATFTLIAYIILCAGGYHLLHLILMPFDIDCIWYWLRALHWLHMNDCVKGVMVASYCWGLIRWSNVFTVHINCKSKISKFFFGRWIGMDLNAVSSFYWFGAENSSPEHVSRSEVEDWWSWGLRCSKCIFVVFLYFCLFGKLSCVHVSRSKEVRLRVGGGLI